MPDTTMTWASVAPAVGEIFLTFAVCAVLLIDVFVGDKRRGLTGTLTLIMLAITAALLMGVGQVASRIVLFNGLFVADPVAWVLKLAALLIVAITLLYSRSYMGQRGTARGEYYVLAMTALLVSAIARERLPLDAELVGTLTAWLDCYVGQNAEPRLRELLADVQVVVDPGAAPGQAALRTNPPSAGSASA